MNRTTIRLGAESRGRQLLALAGMALLCLAAVPRAGAATVGRVVSIGGHASDLALDEGRGVIYIANFSANRVEVMSLEGNIQTSINVAAQPSSLALSPDGRYLVVAHYSNFETGTSGNGLTVVDLVSNNRQTFVLGAVPYGVAFGIDNRAVVVTATEFILFDPVSGATQVLTTIASAVDQTLPRPPGNFPPNITRASVVASGDGLRIWGMSNTFRFVYDVTSRRLQLSPFSGTPELSPRTVSVSYDGSYAMLGWAQLGYNGELINQFSSSSGILNVGTHVIDSNRGVIYTQYLAEGVTAANMPAPVLQVVDADNLAVREKWQLAENLAGKSLLNSDGSVMYAISDSGVTIIPVGTPNRLAKLQTTRKELVFRGNACDRRTNSQEITILDPGGANVDFTLTSSRAGVTITPASGVTPATVRINVDPNAFQNQKGTVTVTIDIKSERATNIADPIKVLINNKEPDQRGSVVNVAGTLVDLLADPIRDRFYVLRQDNNSILVFEGSNQTQVATLRTYNTPTQLAITFDRRYLLVGHDNSSLIKVFDLETLEESLPVRMPPGVYPRSIGVSARSILVAPRDAPDHKIHRVDFLSRTAAVLPTLGVFENKNDIQTTLLGSSNGSSILAVSANGTVMLYNANADTFTVARKDATKLSGAYAASNFDQFVIGSSLLNSSLVPMRQFETATGSSSGFFFFDQGGFRVTASDAANPGIIQRFDSNTSQLLRSTRTVEAPLLPVTDAPTGGSRSAWLPVFTRTVAPLANRTAVVMLTQSGFTVLPWTYDAGSAAPRIERVVNAADGTGPVAPGSLVSIFGTDLSPTNQASQQMPLPTALGESCLTVNGLPIPVVFVSPAQINGQLPFQVDGNVTLILRTPGGVSDNFNLTILPNAPSVFRNATAGTATDLPAIYRSANNLLVTQTNPIRGGDTITIYLTGLGRTSPSVPEGIPAPDPGPGVLVEPAVSIGGVGLPVNSAGLAPGTVGVYQINARVPFNVPLGLEQILTISQGAGSTSLSVRVVD